jgi:hypothetical protein
MKKKLATIFARKDGKITLHTRALLFSVPHFCSQMEKHFALTKVDSKERKPAYM